MSGVSDGATTRRERILDMLQYVRGFMPRGVSLTQVQGYMSMAHGLTYKKTLEYVTEVNQTKIVDFALGLIVINQSNFRRLIEIMAPDRDPETGLRRDSVFLPRNDFDDTKPRRSRSKKKRGDDEDPTAPVPRPPGGGS